MKPRGYQAMKMMGVGCSTRYRSYTCSSFVGKGVGRGKKVREKSVKGRVE